MAGWPVALAIWAVSFALYLLTLAPSITWSNDGADSGDLAVAVARLSVPHPTGYPTYVLLGKIFSLAVPIGDVAYRLNVMSALLASLAVLLVYLSTLELISLTDASDASRWPGRASAALAAIALAVSSAFWSQATIAEVHALQAFFLALFFYLALRGRKGSHRSFPLLLAAFVFGLALGNQVLAVLVLLPACLLLWKARPAWPPALAMVALAVAGLAVYVLLPLRASQETSWGEARSLSGFWWIVSGAPYRDFFFGLPVRFLPSRIASFANIALSQFTALGLALALLGLGYLWQVSRGVVAAIALFALPIVTFAIFYDTTDSYLYLLPFFLLMAPLTGLGVHYFLTSIFLPWLTAQERGLRVAMGLLVAVLLLSPPAFSLARNLGSQNLRQDRAPVEYARSVEATVEAGSLILADTDPHTFALWYYRYVQSPNWETSVVSRGLLQYQWYWDKLRRLHPDLQLPQQAGYEDRLLSLTGLWMNRASVYLTDEDPLLERRFAVEEQGPVFRVLPPQPQN